jgi:MFS family permease
MLKLKQSLGKLLIVTLGTTSAALDTSVNIAFPDITAAFSLDAKDIQWVVIAYMLTFGSLMLIFGRLGDIFGHRRIFQIGLVATNIAFFACALAPSFWWLVYARVFQGAGLALVVSCGPALATSAYSESERRNVLGAYGALFAIGNALGPLVGGMLIEQWGWSAVFWYRAPLVFAALALSGFLPLDDSHGSISDFDVSGAVLLALGMSAMLLAFTSLKWAGPASGSLALAAVATGAFAVLFRHLKNVTGPIIQLAPFRDATFCALHLASILVNVATFAVLLLVPYYFIVIAALPAPLAGFLLAVGALGTMVGSLVGSRLSAMLGNRRIARLGIISCATGLGAISMWSQNLQPIEQALALLLQGVGLGLFQIAYTDVVIAIFPVKDRGVAGSIIMVTRTIGIVGGASGLSAVFQYHQLTALAIGNPTSEAFLEAFQATLRIASLSLFLPLVLTIMRPRHVI